MNKSLKETIIEIMIKLFASVSILTTVMIIFTLVSQSIPFFAHVPITEFLFGTVWSPVGANPSFGVVPLVIGTFMIVVISSMIALPLGLGAAIYMSQYASHKTRAIIKPILELLAGIPSVIYGFFALRFITPIIQMIFPQASIFNALSAGIAVGIMILPTVASLSEDAMHAVPISIKEASLALGTTEYETTTRVLIPAAFSGIVSSFILALSRAIGETMIVAIAAGATPALTLSPLNSIQTMTGFIVNKVQGEVVVGSVEYQTIYAVALLLFVLTLFFNYIAKYVAKKYQNKYE